MSHSSFRINVNQCKTISDNFSNIENQLKQSTEQLESVLNQLKTLAPMEITKMKLRLIKNEITKEAKLTKLLHTSLNNIAIYYQSAENKVLGSSASFFNWGFTENEIDSVVFDYNGGYGGDQGSPMSLFSDKAALYDIVRKYYPNMSDREINDYLKKLNSEGCGYVAIINTIFAAYEGREAEFEKTFGFSMYNKDGDLNYNKLLVDFYSATDNHNKRWFTGKDYIDNNEDSSNVKGCGTTSSDREYRTKLYLNEKGVDVSVTNNCDVTIDNFNEYSKNGYVIISYHDGNLQNEDGSTAQPINGGHAMVVTGTTSDGRFIVSSWGEKYYIDPNEITKFNGKKTHFKFDYYQY